MARRDLIADHWFREGPMRPDGSDGYWICDRCGQHRGDHLQAEGDWRKPLHVVVPMRVRPSHCKACGRHHRHTTHIPWTWEQLGAAS
ncbi:hypothetical protein I3W98_33135 [Streptomyces cavourensis]|nr:hypothetical protein [Streptomyces cavourensis]